MNIQRQARILLARQRQRSKERQSSMLSRSVAEVGRLSSEVNNLQQESRDFT